MLVVQPNGLYCLFDDFDDQPVKWNITQEQYIKEFVKLAKEEALENLKYSENIKYVYENFYPDENMSMGKFNEFLKAIGSNETYESIHKHKFDPWGDGYDN